MSVLWGKFILSDPLAIAPTPASEEWVSFSTFKISGDVEASQAVRFY
jgi:hypothetical protein